jgi:hypothetical protein
MRCLHLPTAKPPQGVRPACRRARGRPVPVPPPEPHADHTREYDIMRRDRLDLDDAAIADDHGVVEHRARRSTTRSMSRWRTAPPWRRACAPANTSAMVSIPARNVLTHSKRLVSRIGVTWLRRLRQHEQGRGLIRHRAHGRRGEARRPRRTGRRHDVHGRAELAHRLAKLRGFNRRDVLRPDGLERAHHRVVRTFGRTRTCSSFVIAGPPRSGATRQSILTSLLMDARVKPGHDADAYSAALACPAHPDRRHRPD